ncbi:MAG: type II toxin-antitoxin system Phd/YefM family antitoxin [Betaproteobacteria bacterium]
MNLLTIAELKRRGMAAIEESLTYGPVHILKHNRPAAVVISEQEYQQLAHTKNTLILNNGALQWVLDYAVHGQQPKSHLDARLSAERNAWDAS